MGSTHRLPCRRAGRVLSFAVWLSCVTSLLGQAVPENSKPAIEVPPAPASASTPQKPISCGPLAETPIPLKATIEAKVTGTLEANHLKVGQKLWVNSVYEMDYPDCRMAAGAPIYGTVTLASSSKKPGASELGFVFDAVDCVGRSRQTMKLALIGVIAPPDEGFRGHDAVPTEVNGGARQISDTAGSTSGYDANLGPRLAQIVQVGSVVGFKKLKLEPQGGPGCSARLTNSEHNIALAPGTVLVLTPLHTERGTTR
jgi:hypothetical protein